MKKLLKWAAIGLVVLVVLGALFGGEGDDADATDAADGKKTEQAKEPAATEKKKEKKPEKPKFDGTAWATQLEDEFLEGMGGREIDDMCNSDNAYTHWGCFYKGVSADHEGTLWIELVTDGGWSDGDLKQLSEEAARHWYNFVGPDHKELDTIVVKVNGRDHNHFRRSFPGADR